MSQVASGNVRIYSKVEPKSFLPTGETKYFFSFITAGLQPKNYLPKQQYPLEIPNV